MWKARASVIGFVPVIAELDYHPLVLRSSAALIRREERFAKTAVGWVPRDLSKYDSGKVTAFVDQQLQYFSTESIRNALKYSPEATRRKRLKGMKTAQRALRADRPQAAQRRAEAGMSRANPSLYSVRHLTTAFSRLAYARG